MRSFSISFHSFLSVFLLLASSMACTALESVEKVEKSTADVGQKMDKTNGEIEATNQKMDEMKREIVDMNDKLVEANDRIENMNKALERIYQDLRQGDSLAARLGTIEKLSEERSLKGKTVYAAQYLMSFEYQLWKGEGFDNQSLQDILKRDAVDEFIQTLRRFAKTTLPINTMSQDRDLLSVQALVLASHIVNSNSAHTMGQKNVAMSSMHDLLRESLNYGHKLSQGSLSLAEIPEYAQYALRDPELVRYAFELRINMLPAMVLSELSQVASDVVVSRWRARVSSWLQPWNADLGKKSEIELREYVTWMKWANSDLSFLRSIGIEPRLDSFLFRTLKNGRIVNHGESGDASGASARAVAAQALKSAINTFLSQLP